MSDVERPALRALAARLGIADSYFDLIGRARPTSDATREALVAAMRFDASSEAAAQAALAQLDERDAAALVEPVVVWREFEGRVPVILVAAPPSTQALDCEIEIRLEDGARHAQSSRVEPDAPRPVAVGLPLHPPFGHHDVTVRVGAREGSLRFVMAPRTVLTVQERIGDARRAGLWTNLYSVRSARSWGFGDTSDLRALLAFAGRRGLDFVGVNPLHATPNRGDAITPYSPSSRLFRNVLYLDVEAVPEWRDCEAARSATSAAALARARAADRIDHEAVLELKLAPLRACFAAFERERAERPDGARAAAYDAYVAGQGARLRDFATWEALAEHCAAPGQRILTDWRRWPVAFQRPDSPEVAAFREAHADAVAFRAWLQFELDRQLAGAAAAARDAGLAIGLYQDLAVGSAGDSADTWMAPALFAEGASVGAPPDDYAPEGQNWGLPPFDPHALRADGYRFFTELLRASFAHAGALRIDHAMGLLRLFWIPRGMRGDAGTYVRQRADDLFGVLALESRRAGALVIAEDLGTVPDEFPPLVESFGLLSSSVLYFERDGATPRPSSRISARALATVGTHDLAPLAGWAEGADLAIRRAIGEIADDAALEGARSERGEEWRAWVARLREEGLLPGEGDPGALDFAVALHAFLARTPAPLVAASLDDLAGEREPVNVPGVAVDRHRSWSRRMALPLEALAAHAPAQRILDALAPRARASAGREPEPSPRW
jgi:4-alpha-glucanotransferase